MTPALQILTTAVTDRGTGIPHLVRSLCSVDGRLQLKVASSPLRRWTFEAGAVPRCRSIWFKTSEVNGHCF